MSIEQSKQCPHRIEYTDNHRQQNTLRVETMQPEARCIQKLPEHWPEGAKTRGGLAWIASGGSCLVFGVCDERCPPGSIPREKARVRDQGGTERDPSGD